MQEANGVILMGGGLDSTALLLQLIENFESFDLHDRLVAMHFQYGQRAHACELKAVYYWCEKLGVPLKIFKFPLHEIADSAILLGSKLDSNKLEGRNVIFTMLAATYAATIGASDIYLGYHQEPDSAPFPDATRQAAKAMQHVISTTYKHKLNVVTPFEDMSRSKILRLGFDLDEEIITHTHTCYEGIEGGCGECVHCKQRATMINNLLMGADAPLEENY